MFFLRTKALPEIEEEETKLMEAVNEKYNQNAEELEAKIEAYKDTCFSLEKYVDQKSKELLKEVGSTRQTELSKSDMVDRSVMGQWSTMLS